MNLKGKSFLKLLDFTTEEIEYLLDLAAELKDKKKKGIPVDFLRGKNVALHRRKKRLFHRPDTSEPLPQSSRSGGNGKNPLRTQRVQENARRDPGDFFKLHRRHTGAAYGKKLLFFSQNPSHQS